VPDDFADDTRAPNDAPHASLMSAPGAACAVPVSPSINIAVAVIRISRFFIHPPLKAFV
jgi:hypothetical protein